MAIMPAEFTVHYFERKPGPGSYSLERVFSDVRAHLPAHIHAKVLKCPYESRGTWNRVRNILWARRNAGAINHITGDVHYLALLLPKQSTILTIADCVSVIRSAGLKRWLLWLFWYRLPSWRVRMITTISEFTRAQFLALVASDPDKVRAIHCPVSEEFKIAPQPFNAERPIVLQIGTGPNKNLSRVVEALAGISCQLRVVGPLDERQKDEIQKSGIDYRQYEHLSNAELVDLYKECDLVVFASTYEGFGLPIVEAQAAGKPVVTSTLCSMPEVAGEGACLVDPFEVTAIRDGVLRIIRDGAYRDFVSKMGIENVSRFDPKRIAACYADLYTAILSD